MSLTYLTDDSGRLLALLDDNLEPSAVPQKACPCCRIRIVQAARTPAEIIRAQSKNQEIA